MTVINAGYPMFGDAVLCCPFDDFADNVRGLMELCMDVVTDPETVDQALEIKNTQIADELALPPVKIHCSILAEDAIKAAVADYKKQRGE